MALTAGPAAAGHEMPFYPSYYPQEITVETLPPAAAAPRLSRGTLHAYLGADPFAGRALPPNVTGVESLAGYVVVSVSPQRIGGPDERCRLARQVIGRLARDVPGWRFHPHVITPHHPDYLYHADRAAAAFFAVERDATEALPSDVRVEARGALARRLVGATAGSGPGDIVVEEIPLERLLAPESLVVDGWIGPPWLKEGWYHTYLLHSSAAPGERRLADLRAVMPRALDRTESVEDDRRLVARLGARCERQVAGYTLRRQALNVEYSRGVENIGWDSQAGLGSAIFWRTVKLKDFPWNGWLAVGTEARPTAAWNPIAGFTDPVGRALWAAVGDPALLPEPAGGHWLDNRVRVERTVERGGSEGIHVPRDALQPEAGTGRLRPVGQATFARARLTYRVLASKFQDGSATTAADLLAAYAYAFAWGGRAAGEPGHEPDVASATVLLRKAVKGVRVARVDQEKLRFGEVEMRYDVPVVNVYLSVDLPDVSQLASVAPPWTTVPWPLLALMDEAVRRGWATLSESEARRLRRPWLDLVRDPILAQRLAALTGEFATRSYVPEPLQGLVTPAEAAARWTALRRFATAHRHWLVTNGPYQIHAWTPTRTVLRVVRDFSYPLGVGSFDAYPLPVRARVKRAEPRDGALTVWADVERVERFGREHRITTGPLGPDWPERDRAAVPTCRFVLLAADGRVLATGALPPTEAGTFVIPLDRAGGPVHTALVVVVVKDNLVDAEVRVLEMPRRSGAR